MAALTEGRQTPEVHGGLHGYPVAAATHLYAGGIGCLDASGNLVPGSAVTTLTAVGRIEADFDNSAGVAGDIKGIVKEGDFVFENSASADEITTAAVGNDCYIVDDQTVAKTNGSSTRSVAGKVINVNDRGVIVRISIGG